MFEFNAAAQQWNCFLCNHPERAPGFLQENHPLMEGQLKEKKNKWLIFRRWRTRYFTLSGAHLSYRETVTLTSFKVNWFQLVTFAYFRNRTKMQLRLKSIRSAVSKSVVRGAVFRKRSRFSPAIKLMCSKPKMGRTLKSGFNVCPSLLRRLTHAPVLPGQCRNTTLPFNPSSVYGPPFKKITKWLFFSSFYAKHFYHFLFRNCFFHSSSHTILRLVFCI